MTDRGTDIVSRPVPFISSNNQNRSTSHVSDQCVPCCGVSQCLLALCCSPTRCGHLSKGLLACKAQIRPHLCRNLWPRWLHRLHRGLGLRAQECEGVPENTIVASKELFRPHLCARGWLDDPGRATSKIGNGRGGAKERQDLLIEYVRSCHREAVTTIGDKPKLGRRQTIGELLRGRPRHQHVIARGSH